MPLNLRVSLTIFAVGFLVEAAGDLYLFLHGVGPFGQTGGVLLFLSPAITVVGLLFLYIGRHEWNELHHQRVRHAHLAFGFSLLFLGLAALPVVVVVLHPSTVLPSWVTLVFAVAVAGTVALTFVTYGLIAFHLVRPAGQVTIGLAVAWGCGVAFLMGEVLAGHLPTIVTQALSRTLDVASVSTPITTEEALLGGSYLLLFAAFLDAHRTVARGLPVTPPPPANGTPAS